MAEGPKSKEPVSEESESKQTGQVKQAARPRKPRARKAVATAPSAPEPEKAQPVIDPEHPTPGEPEAPGDPGTICANCGTRLAGPYCHQCGQQGHLHNKLGHLLHEFVEGIAHFDGRLWRTLPLLAWRPGRLSRDWIEGKRARYVAPLHIFLFALFLMFTIPTFIHYETSNTVNINGAPVVIDAKDREAVMKEQREKLAALNGKHVGETSGPQRLANQAVDFFDKRAGHWDYYQLKIQSLLYKFGFLMAPISMLILWLVLFYKRGYTLYDHATVALYGLGFTALLAAFGRLLPPSIAGVWTFLMMLFIPVHAVRHLKVAYAMGWPGAIFTGLVMGLLTLMALGLFIGAIFLIGILGVPHA
ncbi:MAG: DUF3667 domain-containing protein [Caulobacter sp.]|nr:DUF3667 domain-containing protein [Caulobacter sp.]